jgi:hypothetical protein
MQPCRRACHASTNAKGLLHLRKATPQQNNPLSAKFSYKTPLPAKSFMDMFAQNSTQDTYIKNAHHEALDILTYKMNCKNQN